VTAGDERVGGSTLNERTRGRGWQLIESIEASFQRGEIDAAEWHARIAAIIGPAYLSAADPRAQSGFAGSPAEWESARRFQFAAIRRDGTFLDVGCANGLLLECAVQWLAEDGVTVEPYGLEILPDLAALARQRLPHWADRIMIGNALDRPDLQRSLAPRMVDGSFVHTRLRAPCATSSRTRAVPANSGLSLPHVPVLRRDYSDP
jgi:hypothetical protein